MKNFLLFSLSVLLVQQAFSQCDTLRYKHAIFNDVTVHKDIKYGEGQVWNIPYNNTDLFMDIYEPTNDTLTKRPLMIWVHPGGFLNGSKEAEDMVALCDSFARRGYVTVSIDYRKGFNPLSTNSAERAVYRGTQDARSAIRFMKEYRNDYGIDTNYTFIGGSSAGGFSSLHTAYLEQHEAPSSIQGSLGVPNLGDLDDSGNPYMHEMNLTGIVNLWGAIGDSNWVSSHETVPALLVHGTNDGTVPYGVGHPFGVFTTPITHGTRSVSNQLDLHGITHQTLVFPGEGHEPHGTSNGDFEGNPPTPYWDTIFDAVRDHYFATIEPSEAVINSDDFVCLGDTITISAVNGNTFCWSGTNMEIINDNGSSIDVVFNETGSQSVEVVNYSSIRANGKMQSKSIYVHPLPDANFDFNITTEDVTFSAETLGYADYFWDFGDGVTDEGFEVDHIYTTPGVYEVKLTTVDANGCSSTEIKTIDMSTLNIDDFAKTDLNMFPNPSTGITELKASTTISNVEIYDLTGKKVLEKNIQNEEGSFSVESLNAGNYFTHVFFESGERAVLKLAVQ